MLLALDIGNTNVTVGLFRAGALLATRRAATDTRATADELELVLGGLLGLDGIGLADLDAIALASVVPVVTGAVESIAARHDIRLVSATAGSVPLAVRVDRPGDVGADRLVNALAAARLHGTPAVVVDLGTATTFDCVASDGAYVGGAIAPGLALGIEALAARTAKLPRVELRAPDRAIGRDTVTAIQSGAVLGYQSLVSGLLTRIRLELGDANGVAPADVRAILTGGLSAAPWASGLADIDAIDPDLTLKGLAILYAEVGGGEPLELGLDVSQPLDGRLIGRLIGLGVTGSIAAYKAVELLRLLRAEGADVSVMLTPSAARFVGPLSFAALSRHPVETDVLDLLPDGRIGHIVLADTADAVVVAPATAHFLGSMAGGLSGDVVTATCLATSAPVVVAPAMDGDMWSHPATVANVARLRTFGYGIVEPGAGPLASGQSGVGRLADLSAIVDAVVAAVGPRPVRAADPAARPPLTGPARDADLAGRHIVVTAGGTREAIDPVRFIGNRSTGRMGVAIAEAALDRGARVTIIAANTEVPLPSSADVVRVESTADLRAALLRATHGPDGGAGFDALVMAAAVADFRPATPAETKLPREELLTLRLESTPDLLAEVARIARGLDSDGAATRAPLAPRPLLVGFAAETGSLERAGEKLRRKGVDLLVANDVAEPGSGFGTETNRVSILAADGSRDDLPLQSKRAVADALLDRVAAALDERDASAHTGPITEPEREPA